jgi:hypothetical protein
MRMPVNSAVAARFRCARRAPALSLFFQTTNGLLSRVFAMENRPEQMAQARRKDPKPALGAAPKNDS